MNEIEVRYSEPTITCEGISDDSETYCGKCDNLIEDETSWLYCPKCGCKLIYSWDIKPEEGLK